METVQLPRHIVNEILAHVQSQPEAEVCGLISASDGIARRSFKVDNVANDNGNRYTMDPKGQIEAMRRMREQDENLFAIYHSHPHSPAAPSVIDLQQANYPDALYLIVSLNTTGVLEMSGYFIRDEKPQAVHLEMVE